MIERNLVLKLNVEMVKNQKNFSFHDLEENAE
jgi:hypothetical protein